MIQIILICFGVWLLLVASAWLKVAVHKIRLYDKEKSRLDHLDYLTAQFKLAQEQWSKRVQDDKQAMELLAKEKCIGFPWLATAYADYFHLQDMKIADSLTHKDHPARRAADKVKESALKRRTAEKLLRVNRYQLEFYESLFPWLSEFKSDEASDLEQLIRTDLTTNKDNGDPAKHWLTPAEYDSLSPAEKYQLALDRYWQKKKTKWELGRDYERFIGHRYETTGWKVQYKGIVEGFADLGRDLIASKDDKIHVVQCKYWSQYKTIHEKHIFQLFGTVIAFKLANQDKEVSGIFIASTTISEEAKRFAKELNITIRENHPFEAYPCVKCNVSHKDGTKIYHLPFDQQYDTTTIDPNRGEAYVATVAEAENLGFRRAFRWKGNKDAPT